MITKLLRYELQKWMVGWWLGLALLLVAWPGALQASGCTDPYDDNGNSNDNLTSHPHLTAVPAQINRSLCGFYNADYVEFPTEPGASYRIQVVNHEDAVGYGVYLELWESPDSGVYHHLATTAAGTVLLDTPTTVTGNLIVRIASTRGDIGSYGGGDYHLSITVNGNTGPTATPTVTSTPSPTPRPSLTPTITATPVPTATPNRTQAQQFCLPLIMQ